MLDMIVIFVKIGKRCSLTITLITTVLLAGALLANSGETARVITIPLLRLGKVMYMS